MTEVWSVTINTINIYNHVTLIYLQILIQSHLGIAVTVDNRFDTQWLVNFTFTTDNINIHVHPFLEELLSKRGRFLNF